jgi:HEXXH motif-containing protein
LAAGLTDRGWKDLYHDTGLTPSEYGTERMLARDRNAPRKIVSVIPASLDDTDPARVFQIELLGRETARRYEESGVRFYSEDEITQGRITERVVETVNILKNIPTLFTAVTKLVRAVHLIDAGKDDYDVSFSEPHVPFSIFVSVPKASNITNMLRLTEAIVHEAMHLQLTLIEKCVPLAHETQLRIFSPWRGEYRSIRGVLHGLYVFRVIDRFLECLLRRKSYPDKEIKYIQGRRDEIVEQINKVSTLRGHPELTLVGDCFVDRLIHP